MNAGTLTQALTASRYKANPTAGSREKQDDTVSFMDMFAQNLKDARKTGTKEPDKKRDGAADSKAQEMRDTGRNQAAVDQGKKSGPSEPIEDGTCRDGSKKAESGVENTDKDSDSGKHHNEGAAAEAINLQAMSLLMQEVPAPAQAGEVPDIQAAQDAASSPSDSGAGSAAIRRSSPGADGSGSSCQACGRTGTIRKDFRYGPTGTIRYHGGGYDGRGSGTQGNPAVR